MIDADRLSIALKTPLSNGTTHLVLSPLEFLTIPSHVVVLIKLDKLDNNL